MDGVGGQVGYRDMDVGTADRRAGTKRPVFQPGDGVV
jgi:hypothetical protein